VKKATIGFTALLAAAAGVSASPVTFFGEDINNGPGAIVGSLTNTRAAQTNFNNNLNGNSTEGFEGFADFTNNPNLTFTGSAGNLNASLTGNGTVRSQQITGAFATEGSKYFYVTTSGGGGGAQFTINFNSAIAAFGFVATDLSDFGATLQLNLSGGGNMNVALPNTVGSGGSTSGSAFFFGLIAEQGMEFTSITFDIASGPLNDTFGFDEMTIGDREQVNLIPLPSAAGIGLAGLGLIAVRRRRA